MNNPLKKVSPAKVSTITEAGCAKFFAWCTQMKNAGGAPLLYVAFNNEMHLSFFEEYDAKAKRVTLNCCGAYGAHNIAISDVCGIWLADKAKFLPVAVACENANHRLWPSRKTFVSPVGEDGYVVLEPARR